MLVWKLLTRSTRFTYFCTAQISKFQPEIVNIFFARSFREWIKMNFRLFSFSASNFPFFLRILMKCCPDFATNSRKGWRVSLFQSNLRKQVRKLSKIQKSVKIIYYYPLLFIRVHLIAPLRAGVRAPLVALLDRVEGRREAEVLKDLRKGIVIWN